MPSFAELRVRAQHAIYRLPIRETQQNTVLAPQEAAEVVFEKLTSRESDRRYVKEIGALYTGEGYEPSAAANAIFSYGLQASWFSPDNPHSRRELQSDLKTLFNIKLEAVSTGDSEYEFVDTLGRKINDLVAAR